MRLNLQAARAFAEAHGTPIERARMRALLDGKRPPDVPPELAVLQNPDGGFPLELRSGAPSTLHHTALVLEWLGDLGQSDSSVAGGAYAFVLSRHALGGIWREAYDLDRTRLPLWMDPESTEADIYTTALCAATLAGHAPADLALDRAVAWLQTQQGRDGLLHGFRLHASWLAVPAFAYILGEDARATRRLVAGLGGALDAQWAPSMVADLLSRLLQAGYSLRTTVVERAWELLHSMQSPDGSFQTEEGAEGSVAATLTVLKVSQAIRTGPGPGGDQG